MTWPKKDKDKEQWLTCGIWDTDYNYDNWEPEFMTIFVAWQLRVTLDSIRNSCDVLAMVLLQWRFEADAFNLLMLQRLGVSPPPRQKQAPRGPDLHNHIFQWMFNICHLSFDSFQCRKPYFQPHISLFGLAENLIWSLKSNGLHIFSTWPIKQYSDHIIITIIIVMLFCHLNHL